MDLSLIPEASASCLIELIEEGNYFGEGTGDEKLRRAFIQFQKECKRLKIRSFDHNLSCVQTSLSL